MKEVFAYLIPILAQIESGGDPNAVSKNGAFVGILQISVAVIMDVNKVRSTNYDQEDRLDPLKSAEICEAYLTHYWSAKIPKAPKWSNEQLVDLMARIWNGGPSGYLKQSTMSYGLKAVELYRSIQDAKKLAENYNKLFPSRNTDDAHPFDFGMQASLRTQRDR